MQQFTAKIIDAKRGSLVKSFRPIMRWMKCLMTVMTCGSPSSCGRLCIERKAMSKKELS